MMRIVHKRHKVMTAWVALCLGGMLASSIQAQETAPKRLKDYDLPGLANTVKLNAIDPWDVGQLIEFLALKGGLNNIVIGQGVSGMTTKLKFENVSVGDALEIVLSVNNLAYEVRGGIITIMTDAEYLAQHGVSFYEQKRVQVVDLKFADPSNVATMLASVKSALGTVVADPVSGTLILIDTPEKIEEMQRIISRADLSTVSRQMPVETKTFVLQYADVDEIQGEVSALLTPEAGTMRVDRRTHTLIVSDLPHNLPKVEHLIQMFDRRQKQVFIEAKIASVELSDAFSLGVDWNHVFQGINPRMSLETAQTAGGPTDPTLGITYNTIAAGGNLELVLTALKTEGNVRILSNPQIAVADGEEATIEVVDDQPYKELQLESGTTNVTSVTYVFKKVGVQLGVTPRIGDDGMINVAVRPEISDIVAWYDGAPQEGTPVIRKSVAETTLVIKDGVTLIIGGLIQNRKDNTKRSVPFLGSIPLIGGLFRYDANTSQNSETIIFLTPRIVTGEEPFMRMGDQKKQPKPFRTAESVVRDEKRDKPLKPLR